MSNINSNIDLNIAVYYIAYSCKIGMLFFLIFFKNKLVVIINFHLKYIKLLQYLSKFSLPDFRFKIKIWISKVKKTKCVELTDYFGELLSYLAYIKDINKLLTNFNTIITINTLP